MTQLIGINVNEKNNFNNWETLDPEFNLICDCNKSLMLLNQLN